MRELTKEEEYIIDCMKKNPAFHRDDIIGTFLYADDFGIMDKLYNLLKANPNADLDDIGDALGWNDNDKEEDGKIDG